MSRVSQKSHPPRDTHHFTRLTVPLPSRPVYHSARHRPRTLNSSPLIVHDKNLIGVKSITKESSSARYTSPHAPHSSSPIPPSLPQCSSSPENPKFITSHRPFHHPSQKPHRCQEYHKRVIPRAMHITSRASQFLSHPAQSITVLVIRIGLVARSRHQRW